MDGCVAAWRILASQQAGWPATTTATMADGERAANARAMISSRATDNDGAVFSRPSWPAAKTPIRSARNWASRADNDDDDEETNLLFELFINGHS